MGVRLENLVGVRFQVGGVILEGIRLCEPCAHLSRLVEPRLLPGLRHRAGLRARIVSGGPVRLGDAITHLTLEAAGGQLLEPVASPRRS